MATDDCKTRTCTSCKTAKPATREHFHAYKRAPDGCRAVCRECRAKEHAEHRDERTAKRREHYQANRDRLLAVSHAYYQDHLDEQRAAGRARHHRNRDLRLVQMREYRASKVEELNSRRRPKALAAFHARYGADLEFTLKHRLRALLRVTLTNGRQGHRMHDLLGYSTHDLRAHLERQFTKGMSWQRFMAGEIHIDHIVPVAAFTVRSPGDEEFRACWSLANLRPAWARDNISRRDRRTHLV